jgi:hypothetical protein
MNSLAEAACTRRGGRSRERQWDEISHEREEQQQSGGQAMHGFALVEAYQLADDESKNKATLSHQHVGSAVGEGDDQVHQDEYQVVVPA